MEKIKLAKLENLTKAKVIELENKIYVENEFYIQNDNIYKKLHKYYSLHEDHDGLAKLINSRVAIDRKICGWTQNMENISHYSYEHFVELLKVNSDWLKNTDDSGCTPLMIAVVSGRYKLVELFLSYYDDNIFETSLKIKGRREENAIQLAVRYEHFKCLNMLLNCAVNKGYDDAKEIINCYIICTRNGICDTERE